MLSGNLLVYIVREGNDEFYENSNFKFHQVCSNLICFQYSMIAWISMKHYWMIFYCSFGSKIFIIFFHVQVHVLGSWFTETYVLFLLDKCRSLVYMYFNIYALKSRFSQIYVWIFIHNPSICIDQCLYFMSQDLEWLFLCLCLSVNFYSIQQFEILMVTLIIPHATSCGGYNVIDPSVSQSVSPSVLSFSSQLLWNRSTEFRETS